VKRKKKKKNVFLLSIGRERKRNLVMVKEGNKFVVGCVLFE